MNFFTSFADSVSMLLESRARQWPDPGLRAVGMGGDLATQIGPGADEYDLPSDAVFVANQCRSWLIARLGVGGDDLVAQWRSELYGRAIAIDSNADLDAIEVCLGLVLLRETTSALTSNGDLTAEIDSQIDAGLRYLL